jgi:hypothetical protein
MVTAHPRRGQHNSPKPRVILISDAHEWINEIPTVPGGDLKQVLAGVVETQVSASHEYPWGNMATPSNCGEPPRTAGTPDLGRVWREGPGEPT